ncbi:replication-relaxation family protein [Planobispora takensis]|uniref:Replication-relaxation n=1 Tax=Planobispora takensis TaxID=1367882 RepID=A0A8J3T138_9ACTN|nr:replication-relaxation family protein [Planobispora takensis]GIH99163.1 hypothetical protein Pta02_11720 [Planobispora takensis]
MALPRPAPLALLASRLTDRDRRLMRTVWENRVLTTPQITALFFDSDDTAGKRLLILTRLGVLERFRPFQPHGLGTAPYHYVLGPEGAAVLASEAGEESAALGYRRDRVLAIAHNQRLAHTLGVNDFMAGLATFARRGPDAELVTWWPERRCARMWGDAARPDAYGRWREGGHMLDFFVEHDTGTEPLDRVAAKLTGYAALAESSRISTPVLFWVESGQRETNLRERFRRHAAVETVPVATGCRSALAGCDDGPASELWLPLDSAGPRLRLAFLSQHWPDLGPHRDGHLETAG